LLFRSVFGDGQPTVGRMEADAIIVSTKEEKLKAEETPYTPVCSSSSRSYKSNDSDNMRGFDPTSEDDMDDNGLSPKRKQLRGQSLFFIAASATAPQGCHGSCPHSPYWHR